MLKRLMIVLLIGGLVLGGLWFFSHDESSEESLNKALTDNYAAFVNLAGYMRSNPDTLVIYSGDVKNDPSLKNDFDQISDAGILCVWNKSGAVAFDTGKETMNSDSHYIIYSPNGKPGDYPDAIEAVKENWYLC